VSIGFRFTDRFKLEHRAIAILQRHLAPDGLNDQKALSEIRALIDRTEGDGTGTASEMVRQAKLTMQRHKENSINNAQAMDEMYAIFGRKAV